MNVLQFALEQVNKAFPGVFNIPLADAAGFLGISPKTVRNQLSATGQAPFKTVLRGGKRYVPALALAEIIAADLVAAGITSSFDAGVTQTATATPEPTNEKPTKRGKGRPTKVEQKRREAAAAAAASQEGGAA